MTLQEIAAVTGAAYRTVADYAQRAGWTQNGVQTLLDEKQVAIIVEAMKVAQPNQHSDTLQAALQGIETTQSRAIRIAVLAEKRIEIERQFAAELEAELAEEREKNELLTRQNEALEANAREAAPKLEHYNQCMATKDAIPMKDAAAVLNIPGLGRNNLFDKLRGMGILDGKNQP